MIDKTARVYAAIQQRARAHTWIGLRRVRRNVLIDLLWTARELREFLAKRAKIAKKDGIVVMNS